MKVAKKQVPEEINTFIAQFDPTSQSTLWELRELIAKYAANSTELISYGVACFKTEYMLVGYGGGKGFCSLYVMDPALIKKHKDMLKPYKSSGGTVHFVPGDPLPEKLIALLVKQRVEDNHMRWLEKNQRKQAKS
ncbi:MAG: DUF1801 domain-containing protein [Saprospiraceae bacterium]|nr:DUF1801 domain-containing protein [Saprospiraceae bacterium]MBK7789181.1 DUF1801 domain-containing protein [Saprospiraceae bacterium]MBK8111330.1 DUF1801 domain-containing protein [Saprospiraceae bacterium]MBK8852140.1 DUF1801 domain-containing protein [Saprospiraceae bacterium]MBK9689487.1 DUF1801 domain-containing protein [Saprospiraceae bacterium]